MLRPFFLPRWLDARAKMMCTELKFLKNTVFFKKTVKTLFLAKLIHQKFENILFLEKTLFSDIS